MAFEPKTWACGDTITAQELNRIEQGIVEAGQGGGDVRQFPRSTREDENSNDTDF